MDESLRTEVRVKHFVYILMDSCIEETTEEPVEMLFSLTMAITKLIKTRIRVVEIINTDNMYFDLILLLSIRLK